jgi:hypothetical protein
MSQNLCLRCEAGLKAEGDNTADLIKYGEFLQWSLIMFCLSSE